ADPKQKRRDKVEVKSVRVQADRKSVFLEVPGLQPVDQLRIKLGVKAADGTVINEEIYATIHKVGD
ncbi:MAG TPA: hypothetical protein VNO52_04345, partial [Methylomirabilota bacterium]|nr:hypothetical protein [Methylomirabilota bacterium]